MATTWEPWLDGQVSDLEHTGHAGEPWAGLASLPLLLASASVGPADQRPH